MNLKNLNKNGEMAKGNEEVIHKRKRDKKDQLHAPLGEGGVSEYLTLLLEVMWQGAAEPFELASLTWKHHLQKPR